MASASLGSIIPPSVMLILLGSWAELSVGRLYMAAYLPGLLLAALYAIYIFILCKRNPDYGPVMPEEERAGYTGKAKLKMTGTAVAPPIILIVIVMGAILTGIATPTEASGLGALGAIIIAAATKNLNFESFKEASMRTARVSGMVILIAGGANVFVSCFLRMGGAKAVSDLLLGADVGGWGIIALLMVILLLLGCFISWFGILIILTPIFMPIIKELGFDPIWFGILVCLNLQASFLTPPFGYALFYTKGICPMVAPEVKTSQIFKAIIPWIIMVIVALVIVCAAPQIALVLPDAVYGTAVYH